MPLLSGWRLVVPLTSRRYKRGSIGGGTLASKLQPPPNRHSTPVKATCSAVQASGRHRPCMLRPRAADSGCKSRHKVQARPTVAESRTRQQSPRATQECAASAGPGRIRGLDPALWRVLKTSLFSACACPLLRCPSGLRSRAARWESRGRAEAQPGRAGIRLTQRRSCLCASAVKSVCGRCERKERLTSLRVVAPSPGSAARAACCVCGLAQGRHHLTRPAWADPAWAQARRIPVSLGAYKAEASPAVRAPSTPTGRGQRKDCCRPGCRPVRHCRTQRRRAGSARRSAPARQADQVTPDAYGF